VGKKTAERVVVELKDKMPEVMSLAGEEFVGEEAPVAEPSLSDDLLSALINLGYQRNQADKIVGQVLRQEPELSFELALKKALRQLSR
jgi:Holliday junction DNA helicase RuvA